MKFRFEFEMSETALIKVIALAVVALKVLS